jgi:hypothetical protein
VDAADEGLMAGWTLTRTPDTVSGGEYLDIVSPGDPVKFADFGPLLRLDYPSVPGDSIPLLEDISVDNSIYETGQWFELVNFN